MEVLRCRGYCKKAAGESTQGAAATAATHPTETAQATTDTASTKAAGATGLGACVARTEEMTEMGEAMSVVRINFVKCHQDSQEFGSDDEFMVSRLYFTVAVDGGEAHEAHCDIKQVVGSNYETGSLEVGRIVGVKEPVNYEGFRVAAEQYYRKLVGADAMGIRIEGGSANIRMQNNVFVVSMMVEIDGGSDKGGW